MSLPDVTPDHILNAIQQVPVGRWDEALRAIESLQSVPAATTVSRDTVKTGADLRDSPLIGIWANRVDVKDNHEFARDLRNQAEQRK